MKIIGKREFVLFVFALLVTLLFTAPASLLDRYLQHASQGRLVLANASGTVWNGSATPALRPQDGYFLALQPLHWNVAVLPLFSGKISAQLQWDNQSTASAMDLIVSFNQVELRHAQLFFPARIIEEVSPMLKPARFRGQLQIQSEKILFSRHGAEGSAIVDWQQASSTLSSVDPLGNYRLTLSGAGDYINIVLVTTSGKLLLDGQGNWSVAHGLEFHGKAQASPGNHDTLAELLHNLGPEESPGVHGFNITPRQ